LPRKTRISPTKPCQNRKSRNHSVTFAGETRNTFAKSGNRTTHQKAIANSKEPSVDQKRLYPNEGQLPQGKITLLKPGRQAQKVQNSLI
jgi:hypothetical protein